MPKVAIVDELHELKKSGVHHSTVLLKKTLQSEGIDTEIVCMRPPKNRLIKKLVVFPELRELVILPAWNSQNFHKRLEQNFGTVLFQTTTSLLWLKSKSATKKIVYVRVLLSRQLRMLKSMDVPTYIRLAAWLLEPVFRWAERRSLRHADLAIVPKRALIDELTALGIAKADIRRLPQMVDIKPVVSVVKSKKWDLIYVGRLSPPKNWPLFKAIAEQNSDWQCLAVSPDILKSELKLPPNLKLLSNLPKDKLAGCYRQSRIFVMPSLMESGPVVTLEAMAYGLPVVASVEGAGDFVKDGINGFIIKSNSLDDYFAAIRKLLEDSQLSRQISEHNQAKAQDYTPGSLGPQYAKILNS